MTERLLTLIPNRALVVVSKEKALEILHNIHSSTEEGCKVFGVNSLVRQFTLHFSCNGRKELAKEFLKSCPECQMHTAFPTTSPHLDRFERMGHSRGYKRTLLILLREKNGFSCQKNRGQYRYILVMKDCFSKFCWLFPTKSKSANEIHSILHNFFFLRGRPS